MKEWCEHYRQVYSVNRRDPLRDAQILKPLAAFFGDTNLTEVTAADAQRYVNHRKKGVTAHGTVLKQGTLSREIGLLKAVFNRATDDEILSRNPFRRIKRPPFQSRQRVFSFDEQAKLMDEFNEEYQRLLIVGVGTAMRLYELLHISLEQVDFKHGVIRIPSSMAKCAKAREVPLAPKVITALREQARVKALEGSAPFFGHNPGGVRRAFTRATKRARIPHASPHDMRRTFGTRCATTSMPPATLQRIMGHSSIEITMKYYVHVGRQDLLQAVTWINVGPTAGDPVTRDVTPPSQIHENR